MSRVIGSSAARSAAVGACARLSSRLSKRERTRALLVETAIDLLAERALDAVSIDDFMAAAGMARGTFYNYFQTRGDVLAVVAQYIEDQTLGQVILQLPDNLSHETKLAAVLCGVLRFFHDHPKLGWVQVRLGGGLRWFGGADEPRHHPRPSGRAEPLNVALDEVHRTIQAIAGRDAPILASIIFLEGGLLMMLRRILEKRITLIEAQSVLGMMLRGLGVAEGRVEAVIDEGSARARGLRWQAL